jgi:hypothetical protein
MMGPKIEAWLEALPPGASLSFRLDETDVLKVQLDWKDGRLSRLITFQEIDLARFDLVEDVTDRAIITFVNALAGTDYKGPTVTKPVQLPPPPAGP